MMTEVRSQRMGRLPAASRLQAITEMVDAGSSISIAGLAEQYSVSMETIRRDIAALEKEGLSTVCTVAPCRLGVQLLSTSG